MFFFSSATVLRAESTIALSSQASRGLLQWSRCRRGRIGRVCQQISHSAIADSALRPELDRIFDQQRALCLDLCGQRMCSAWCATPFLRRNHTAHKLELYADDVGILTSRRKYAV